MTAVRTICFKNDGALRKRLFTPESMCHPAKGHMGLWETIISLYTKEGDTVLDPMSGVGSTLLAALMGRNVVCVELEEHFVTMLRANWEKARQHPMLGFQLGNVTIIHGDARNLANLLVDSIITSPPYANRLADTYVDDDPQRMSYTMGLERAQEPGLLADSIITSPPWEDNVPAQDQDFMAKFQRVSGKPAGIGQALQGGYTRPPQADAIVTSPPYAESLEGTAVSKHHKNRPDSMMNLVTRKGRSTQDFTYAGSDENIGNQKGQAYWDSMRIVYAQCYAVLKPGGVMALVVKGFTRDGKYVDLPTQTVELCESLGFVLFDRWARELWALSFWRILQKRRDPAAFDERLNFEEVLAFRKPLEAVALEPSADAVVFSPPYEMQDSAVHPGILKKTKNNFGPAMLAPGYTRPKAKS